MSRGRAAGCAQRHVATWARPILVGVALVSCGSAPGCSGDGNASAPRLTRADVQLFREVIEAGPDTDPCPFLATEEVEAALRPVLGELPMTDDLGTGATPRSVGVADSGALSAVCQLRENPGVFEVTVLLLGGTSDEIDEVMVGLESSIEPDQVERDLLAARGVVVARSSPTAVVLLAVAHRLTGDDPAGSELIEALDSVLGSIGDNAHTR